MCSKLLIRSISTIGKIDVKKFNEIPGPKGPFNFGTIINNIFKNNLDEIHKNGFKNLQKYGKIVREKILPGVYVVWIFDPNDIATVLNESSPGNYPQRKSHLALEKYRKDRPEIYRTGGLLPTNGTEWWKLRSELQKCLSSPIYVRNFLPYADQITKEFVEKIKNSNITVYENFLPELSRLSLELVCFLAFDVRMNSFSDQERSATSTSSKLIEAAMTTNDCTLPTDQGFQLWRIFETKSYKKIREAQEYMESVAIQLIKETMDQKASKLNTGKTSSLFDFYLSNPNLERRDIIGMATDLLLAGIDTTSYTTSFILYHLAKNKNVQEKLFEETKKILANPDDEITTTILNTKIPYTRLVVKESLRLNPISVGVGRISNTDLILSQYEVPKGTIIVTQNLVASQLEEYFPEPEKFIPERWIKTLDKNNKINPFLVLPFGHGARSCIARRHAEQNMILFIIRIIRNFTVEWLGADELDFVTKLINKPKNNVMLKLKKR